MGRSTNALIYLAATALLLCLPSAQAAKHTCRAPAALKVARSESRSQQLRARKAVAPRTTSRLSAGARGPKDAEPEEKAALEIPELRSQANAASVVQALQGLRGVKTAVIDLNTHLAVVDYDPRLTELDHFLVACKEAGFEATEYRVENRFPKPIKLKGG